jgi:hypothetical protein
MAVVVSHYSGKKIIHLALKLDHKNGILKELNVRTARSGYFTQVPKLARIYLTNPIQPNNSIKRLIAEPVNYAAVSVKSPLQEKREQSFVTMVIGLYFSVR